MNAGTAGVSPASSKERAGRPRSQLRQIKPAVHMNGLPGDVAPARRAQQLHGGGDILGLALASDRRLATARDDAALWRAMRARPCDERLPGGVSAQPGSAVRKRPVAKSCCADSKKRVLTIMRGGFSPATSAACKIIRNQNG